MLQSEVIGLSRSLDVQCRYHGRCCTLWCLSKYVQTETTKLDSGMYFRRHVTISTIVVNIFEVHGDDISRSKRVDEDRMTGRCRWMV